MSTTSHDNSQINNRLLEQVNKVSRAISLPEVSDLILPAADAFAENKYAKFGLLVIGESACGFFYRLLELEDRIATETSGVIRDLRQALIGRSPAELSTWINDPSPLKRGVGMAAMNAITQWVYQRSDFELPGASKDKRLSDAGSHIGMVGYFAPTIQHLTSAGTRLTVLELDESLFREEGKLVVTGDSEKLKECDLILCTASTLLNDSLGSLLHTFNGIPVEIIGPTAGCFPDALFEAGVVTVGGSVVENIDAVRSRIQKLEPWGQSVRKFSMSRDNYPGFNALLNRL